MFLHPPGGGSHDARDQIVRQLRVVGILKLLVEDHAYERAFGNAVAEVDIEVPRFEVGGFHGFRLEALEPKCRRPKDESLWGKVDRWTDAQRVAVANRRVDELISKGIHADTQTG